MKFVLTFTPHLGGSETERLEATIRTQRMLTEWQPSPQVTVLQWTNRIDGQGGFAVLEANDPDAMYRDLTTWATFLAFELYPVVDYNPQSTQIVNEALKLRQSIGK